MSKQWVEVVRKDGNVQYATKEANGYLLFGSGFTITQFDAVSVKPVDKVPEKMIKGKSYIDSQFGFESICDVNDRWNGWHRPFIHAKHIKTVCNELSWDESLLTLDKDGVLTLTEPEYTETIEPTTIDGEKYYYLGGLGWCWEFVSNK